MLIVRDGIYNEYEIWYLEDSVPVGYLKALYQSRGYFVDLVLCDIEVRESFQGQGVSSKMIAEIESYFGATLYTSGNYTPKGFQVLASKIPVLNGENAKISFKDMSFVSDWDSKESKFPISYYSEISFSAMAAA